MTTITSAQDVRTILRRTRTLAPNLRVVVTLYSVMPWDRSGAVVATAQELAEEAGMKPSVFSRARTELIETGWLEETSRIGNVRYYRLTAQALGESPTVVQLRPAG